MTGEPGTRRADYLGVAPYLYYADATEALEWLVRVFGFTEKVRYLDSTGAVFQAIVTAGEADIHLTGVGFDYWRTKGVEGPVGQLTVVYVNDVDAQYARVQDSLNADIPAPQDQPYGARVFTIADIGGNSWTFWQQISEKVKLPHGWKEIRASTEQ